MCRRASVGLHIARVAADAIDDIEYRNIELLGMQLAQRGRESIDHQIGGNAFDPQRPRFEPGSDQRAPPRITEQHRGSQPDTLGPLQHLALDLAIDAKTPAIALGQPHHETQRALSHQEIAVAVPGAVPKR